MVQPTVIFRRFTILATLSLIDNFTIYLVRKECTPLKQNYGPYSKKYPNFVLQKSYLSKGYYIRMSYRILLDYLHKFVKYFLKIVKKYVTLTCMRYKPAHKCMSSEKRHHYYSYP